MSLEDAIKANTEATLKLLAAIQALPADLAKQISTISPPSPAAGKSAKTDAKEPSELDLFVASLSSINWKWEDSEDPQVFKTGKAAEKAARDHAEKLGKKAIAAFDAAKKAGLAAGEPASGAAASDTDATEDTGSGEVVIALSDLQKLTQQIQAFKATDATNGPKAMEELKEVIKWTGVPRISDPNLDKAKYPEIKTRLEAIVTKFKIPAVA